MFSSNKYHHIVFCSKVRRPTLRILEKELRKKKTPLFRRKTLRSRSQDGKKRKQAYSQLHFPTFAKMVRPALKELLANHTGNKKKCSEIVDAMMFVTRWRRTNHLTSYRKTGEPLEDLYSDCTASPSSIVSDRNVTGKSSSPTLSRSRKRKRTTPPTSPSVSRTPSPCLSEYETPIARGWSLGSSGSQSSTTTAGSQSSTTTAGFETPEDDMIECYTPGSSPPRNKRQKRRKYKRRRASKELKKQLVFEGLCAFDNFLTLTNASTLIHSLAATCYTYLKVIATSIRGINKTTRNSYKFCKSEARTCW